MAKMNLSFLRRNGIAAHQNPGAQVGTLRVKGDGFLAEVSTGDGHIVFSQADTGTPAVADQGSYAFGAIAYPRGNPHIALGNIQDIAAIDSAIDSIVKTFREGDVL